MSAGHLNGWYGVGVKGETDARLCSVYNYTSRNLKSCALVKQTIQKYFTGKTCFVYSLTRIYEPFLSENITPHLYSILYNVSFTGSDTVLPGHYGVICQLHCWNDHASFTRETSQRFLWLQRSVIEHPPVKYRSFARYMKWSSLQTWRHSTI